MTGASLLPLDTLAATIKAHISAAEKAADRASEHYIAAEKDSGKANEHYISAGIHLMEAKKLVKATPGLTWPVFLASQCGVKRSRADELIAMAGGKTTLEEVRERKADSMRRSRAAANSPPRGGKSDEISQPDQNPTGDTTAEQWHRSLQGLAGESISLTSYWTCLFGEDWKQYSCPSDLATLAGQARDAWKEIAATVSGDTTDADIAPPVEPEIEDLKKQLAHAEAKIGYMTTQNELLRAEIDRLTDFNVTSDESQFQRLMAFVGEDTRKTFMASVKNEEREAA